MSTPQLDDFWGALKPIIFVAQFCALFPVQGIFAKDVEGIRFRWASARTMYSLFFLVVGLMVIFAQVHYTTVEPVSTGNITGILYFVLNFSGAVCFFIIAKRWRTVMMTWRTNEQVFLRPPYKTYGRSLRLKIGFVGFSIIILAIVEDSLHVVSSIRSNQEYLDRCNSSWSFWPMFYYREHAQVFRFIPYNLPLAVLVEFAHKVYLFLWSFMDLFITLLSIGLYTRFEQLYCRIEHLKGKSKPEAFWAEVRKDYIRISNLVEYVDALLSPMILITCASDVYFITFQLYMSVQLKLSPITTFYYRFSLLFLIFRTLLMLLTSSHVYVASRKPLEILRAVPMSSWNISVQRFINEILNIDNALSGHKFFFLKRKIILAMAGTMITYELVMLSEVKTTSNETFCEDFTRLY